MIKFIYFDVGGVLNLDFSETNKWIELRRSLGIAPEQDQLFDALWAKNRSRICIDYDVDNLVPQIEQQFSIKLPTEYSLLTDIVERFEENCSIWSIVEKAAKHYRVGLLTNMYPRMLDKIKQKKQIPFIKWNVEVDSSIVKHQKPEPKMFKYAEQQAAVHSEEILFIDNQYKHLEAAEKRGWKTFLYTTKSPEVSSESLKTRLQV